MKKINKDTFKSGELEVLCKIIADTSDGLTGTEIGYILKSLKYKDVNPDNTKWKRLYNALANRQNETRTGNCVFSFISAAYTPSKFIGRSKLYNEKLMQINTILIFQGLEFKEDGKFHRILKADTLSEAEKRASKLSERLANRNLHNHLLMYCKAELLQHNYFHAVLEATKSISSMIRQKTNLTSDGAKLIDEAFGGSDPLLKINSFQTESQVSEQKGFANLAKGLFGTFRNPTAHSAKIEWEMSEEDAIDLFTLASYVLRRIENAYN